MKRILSLIVLLAAVFTLAAQDNRYSPCYLEAMKAGNSYYSQGRYVEARSAFESAKKCNNGNPEAAQKRINDCNAKIRAQQGGTGGTSTAPVKKEYVANGIAFQMVQVKGGTFTMGCTGEQGSDCDGDEKPSHSVTVSDFWIGETEVTQALWKAVMGTEPTFNGGWTDEYGRGSTYPAYRVSWEDCQEFIRKLNALTGQTFRLPTEAEWEYAARGGSKKSGYKYAGGGSIGDVAWYDGNSGSKTHPVKGKKPNALGLYDMSGNVWEWCADWYDSGYYGVSPSTNPKGPTSGSDRVLRGGGWGAYAEGCRVANRGSDSPGRRFIGGGFRLVLVH